MTDRDELIAILRDWPYMGETYAGEAADILEALSARLAEVEAERDAKDLTIRDLTMLVVKLSKYAPDDKVRQAFDYLHRKNLSSPLRDVDLIEVSPAVEAAMGRFWKRLAEVERARAEAAEARLAEVERHLEAARQIERNVQLAREHEFKRAEAAEAKLDEASERTMRLFELSGDAARLESERADASEARAEKLAEALVDHNDLLRSAMQIAKREGVEGEIGSTNWDAYYNSQAVHPPQQPCPHDRRDRCG